MNDIVDRIDELVDEQLQQERSGYDHNINQDKCWHCGRPWHGLPITERIAAMAARRTYYENYRLADDDTKVLCRGSNFIGPMPGRAPTIEAVTIGSSLADQAIAYANDVIANLVSSVCGLGDTLDEQTPTRVHFWDGDFNAQQLVDVDDWEWTDDRTHARFTIEYDATNNAVQLMQMVVTTENPRRVWRIHQITTYTALSRQLVEVVNIHAELESIRHRYMSRPADV